MGDLSIKPYAFKTSDPHSLKALLADFLLFLNDDSIELIDRLIIGTYQFPVIHPYKGGNGRTWRTVLWPILSETYDETQTLLVIFYIKLINCDGLYRAIWELRKGSATAYVTYWNNCIK